MRAIGVDGDDASRSGEKLDELGLRVGDEDLIRNTHRRPYAGFAVGEGDAPDEATTESADASDEGAVDRETETVDGGRGGRRADDRNEENGRDSTARAMQRDRRCSECGRRHGGIGGAQ